MLCCAVVKRYRGPAALVVAASGLLAVVEWYLGSAALVVAAGGLLLAVVERRGHAARVVATSALLSERPLVEFPIMGAALSGRRQRVQTGVAIHWRRGSFEYSIIPVFSAVNKNIVIR